METVHESFGLQRVLEVGCADCGRLNVIRTRFGCDVVGLEASEQAVSTGRRIHSGVEIHAGVAPDALEEFTAEGSFDLIIVGFLMYVLPRSGLFQLAAGVDRLLAIDGHVVVHDFLFPVNSTRDYAHDASLKTFKTNPSDAWIWSPNYILVDRNVYRGGAIGDRRDPDQWVTVDIARKVNDEVAYPNLSQV